MHGDSLVADGAETSLAGLRVLLLEGAASDSEFVSALERCGASVTPIASSEDAIEALAAGDSDLFAAVVLAEPIEPEDLVAFVARCRRRRTLAREQRRTLASLRANLHTQRARMRKQRETIARWEQTRDTRMSGGNLILATLPHEALRAAVAECEVFRAGVGQVLCWPRTPASAVFFPLTSVVSLTCELSSGEGTEVGMFGAEGVAGADVAFGATSSYRASVVVAGDVLKIPAATFARVYDTHSAFRAAVNAFEHDLFKGAAQTAACNNFHSIEQRVACWLLTAHRLGSSAEIAVTHELLARLLGVRRAGVTVALGDLDRRGLIRCLRGRQHVVNEAGLRAAACECAAAIGR